MATQSSPGKNWGVRSLRSGFGEQPTSNRASAPAAGFGSSSRDAYQKQFASAEVDRVQARSRGNIDNPLGACYAIPVRRSSLLAQLVPQPQPPRSAREGVPLKLLPLSRVFSSRLAVVYGAVLLLFLYGCLQDTMDKQVLSTVASPPRVRFGTGKRPSMALKTDVPGPGAYKMKPTIGGWWEVVAT